MWYNINLKFLKDPAWVLQIQYDTISLNFSEFFYLQIAKIVLLYTHKLDGMTSIQFDCQSGKWKILKNCEFFYLHLIQNGL